MKKIILLLAVIFVVFVSIMWFINLQPIVGTETVKDARMYMEGNDSAQQLLDVYSDGILPSKTTVSPEHSIYEYSYKVQFVRRAKLYNIFR